MLSINSYRQIDCVESSLQETVPIVNGLKMRLFITDVMNKDSGGYFYEDSV